MNIGSTFILEKNCEYPAFPYLKLVALAEGMHPRGVAGRRNYLQRG